MTMYKVLYCDGKYCENYSNEEHNSSINLRDPFAKDWSHVEIRDWAGAVAKKMDYCAKCSSELFDV